MGLTRRKHTLEFKHEAVQQLLQGGVSLSELAERLGIHSNLLRKWKDAFRKNGEVATSTRQPSVMEVENARLRAENERLRMERDILKKATVFFAKESK